MDLKRKHISVQELRDEGFKVGISHKRIYLETTRVKNKAVRKQLLPETERLSERLNAEIKNVTWWKSRQVTVASRNAPVFTRKQADDLGYTKQFERGGLTVVRVTTPQGRLYEGEARCSPVDPYNKKIGLNIALGRAIKQIRNGDN